MTVRDGRVAQVGAEANQSRESSATFIDKMRGTNNLTPRTRPVFSSMGPVWMSVLIGNQIGRHL